MNYTEQWQVTEVRIIVLKHILVFLIFLVF